MADDDLDGWEDFDWTQLGTASANPKRMWPPYVGEDRPIGPDGKWLDSPALCAWMRERCDNVLLGFSTGKDSIVAWHRLREYWPADNIYPYSMYLHPDLQFVERTLRYYERELDTDILRMPNRSLYRMFNDATFQPPHHLPVIWGAGFADLTYPMLYALMAWRLDLPDDTWVAHGIRAADSPMRRMLIEKNGPWRPNERVFYPVHDYYVRDVRKVLRDTGTKLPVDYRLYGMTFDGLDHRFTVPMREHFPDDYERLTDFYPLVPLDAWRRGGPKPDE